MTSAPDDEAIVAVALILADPEFKMHTAPNGRVVVQLAREVFTAGSPDLAETAWMFDDKPEAIAFVRLKTAERIVAAIDMLRAGGVKRTVQ